MANLGESVPYINGKDEYQYLSNTDLVARMIYSEANGESYKGKQGCFRVYANRLYIDKSEFGRTTFDIITNQTNGFDGMKTSLAHAPNTSSQAWIDSCNIAALGAGNSNPVGKSLWFNTNSLFKSRLNSAGKYTFDGGRTYKIITEQHVIGNHTFFSVEGYNF